MNRAIYTFSITLVATPMLTLTAINAATAQSVPQINRLTPLQRQQFARDLLPSEAQDFFSTGNAKLEQEIRRLGRPRSPLNESLLKVNQDRQPQSNDHFKQPHSLPRDRAQ